MYKNKILLVQLYSNGDCLYATTVAKQIKKDFPGAHLTWAIASFCKNILDDNPFIDTIMIIDDVPKNDITAFRRLKKKLKEQEKSGIWNKVFITHIMDTNLAYYDGCIRSNIFNAYPYPITEDVIPVLRLSQNEKQNANDFATQNALSNYDNVVLFEFAPQSGQLPITTETAIAIAEKLTSDGNTAVILSSAKKIEHPNKKVIDGSLLTLRETAALTEYCTLLIGCSSGISWISTSTDAKLLPMIQLVNPDAYWVNPVSRDFQRYGQSTEFIIDIIDFNEEKIIICVLEALKDFQKAKLQFSQTVPLKFKTTRKIIYNLLCYRHFKSVWTHMRVNTRVHGHNSGFYKEVFISIIVFPFKLCRNLILKKLNRIV
ncbi:MAG: glycosyltransferase family 9 protein [Agriterribacter sp.]